MEKLPCPGKFGKKKRCRGVIDDENPLLMTLNGEEKEVFPCSKCKRLYLKDGKPVVNDKGAQAKLITEDTVIFLFDT